MISPQHGARLLPQPGLARLKQLNAPEVLAAWLSAQPRSECTGSAAAKALSDAIPYPEALTQAVRLGLVQGDAVLSAKPQAAAFASRYFAGVSGRDALRALAVYTLNGPAGAAKRGRDLRALGLRQLYALEELAAWPTAQQVRCALLSRIIQPLGGAFAEAAQRPFKAFKFDEMSRRLYLAFACVQRGTVLQADASLLSRGFGGPADSARALAATIIRAAISRHEPEPEAEEAAATFDLDGFAKSVRKLASKLETKPYAGRVAIAQVYDAGQSQGLVLGSLDEFKAHLAEAAREGLLDLERYDITGPFDAGLKERSRLKLGRDERHFIVNQWI